MKDFVTLGGFRRRTGVAPEGDNAYSAVLSFLIFYIVLFYFAILRWFGFASFINNNNNNNNDNYY